MSATLMKKCVIAAGLLAIGIGLGFYMKKSTPPPIGGGGVTDIEFKADLVTIKIPVTEILVAQSDRYQGSWFVRGWANLGIDGHQLVLGKPDAEGYIEFQIPPAKLLDVGLDHERSMKWDIKRTVWYPWWGSEEADKLRDEWQREAQQLIKTAASRPEYKKLAEDQARQFVTALIVQQGHKPREKTSPAPAL
jgi:hypothetical protein